MSTASAETFYCQNCTSTSPVDGFYTFDIANQTFDGSNLIFRPEFFPPSNDPAFQVSPTGPQLVESEIYDNADPDFWWYLKYDGRGNNVANGDKFLSFEAYLPLATNLEFELYFINTTRLSSNSSAERRGGAFFDLVTFGPTPTSVSAIPEPETYAMFLAGLGLLGAVSRRRKQKAAV